MLNKLKNAVWLSLGAIGALWLVTSLAGVVQGGDLDPPATPGPTMQELDDLPPSWHKEISGAARFEDFGQAEGYVLDRETGLVWEAEPDTALGDWYDAIESCYFRTVIGEMGQSKGWRLATAQELGTIIEPMTGGTPKLPAGHPFTGISGIYWTATTRPSSSGPTSQAYRWDSNLTTFESRAKGYYSILGQAWCVRSPSSFDYIPY